MKPSRLIYVVVLAASLVLSVTFHYKYRITDEAAKQERQLQRYCAQAAKAVSVRLVQTRGQLAQALLEAERLNMVIAALEKDNLAYKAELAALKDERATLFAKITTLEQGLLTLNARFHSLDELKKAIRVARIERSQKIRAASLQRRLTKIAMLKQLDEVALRQGNRGYLVLAGASTFPPRTRINVELEPANKFSYRE